MNEIKVKIAGVDAGLWTELRMLALSRRQTVKKILRDAIAEYLDRERKAIKTA